MAVTFNVVTDPPTPGLMLEHVIVVDGDETAVDIGAPTDENGEVGYTITHYNLSQYIRVKPGQGYTGESDPITPVEGGTYTLTVPVEEVPGAEARDILGIIGSLLGAGGLVGIVVTAER